MKTLILKRKSIVLLTILILSACGFAQEKVLYKQAGDVKLYMDVYRPAESDSTAKYPAIVFFFGGGWVGGSTTQFENHAKYLAGRGMVCFLADYRVKSRQNTTPFESLKDAKSAIRFIKANADKFNVDPDKIVASGGSAGGHLAAATALAVGFDEESDDLSISCKPCALVLFNPVIDNGPGGYGYDRIGEKYKDFSPLHNINKDAPPTIMFLGTKDKLIPVETSQYYKKVMERVGSRCDLVLYEGQGHGFFNYKNTDYYNQTLAQADKFLVSINIINTETR